MKLLEQFATSCRTMNFATATREVYCYWVEDFLRFHFRRTGRWVHPLELRETGVEQFLTHLAVDRKLSASSQSQSMCALVFLYRAVLKEPLGEIAAIRAKRPQRLPTVLSVEEVRRVLAVLGRHPMHGLIGQLLYGGGMRVSECCELRVMDIDFDRKQLLIREAKGWKDRAVPLPGKTVEPLREQWRGVAAGHERDLAKGPRRV